MPTATKARTNGSAASELSDVDVLVIQPLEVRTARFRIIGSGPLMTHQWDAKQIRQIEAKQAGEEPTAKKIARDPEAEYVASFYRLPDGRPGIPARAFKKAIITAATHVDGLTKTYLRTAFHCLGDAVSMSSGREGELRPTDLIAIEGSEPEMRTDMVRVGGMSKSADVRYRPEWGAWSCWVTVRYNARSITVKRLTELFNLAGFGVGVGEWRPEKDGMHGMFEVGEVES